MITEWLIQEFQNRSEVRIGANPKLIPAFTWEAWEDELGNERNIIFLSHDIIQIYVYRIHLDSLYTPIKIFYFCYARDFRMNIFRLTFKFRNESYIQVVLNCRSRRDRPKKPSATFLHATNNPIRVQRIRP